MGDVTRRGSRRRDVTGGGHKGRCYRRGPKGEMLQKAVQKVICYKRGS